MKIIKDTIVEFNNFLIEVNPLLTLFLALLPIIISIIIIFIGRKNDKKKGNDKLLKDFCNNLIEIKKIIGRISFSEEEIKNSPNKFLYENYIELSSELEIIKSQYYMTSLPKENKSLYSFIIKKLIPIFIDTMGQIRQYYGKELKEEYIVINNFEIKELVKNLHQLRVLYDDAINIHLENLKTLYSKNIKLPDIDVLDKRYHEIAHRNLVINNIALYGYLMNKQFPKEYIKNSKIDKKEKLFENLIKIMKDEDNYTALELGGIIMEEISKNSNLWEIALMIVNDEKKKKSV